MYQVIDSSGTAFGPVSLDTLRQWATENRVTPSTTIVDQETGQRGPASQLLAAHEVFPTAAVAVAPAAPTQPRAEPQAQPQPQPAPVSYAYKGSTEPGQPPMLQSRAVAFGIDFLLGLMVYAAGQVLVSMLLSRYDYSTWHWLGYLDYFWMPLVMFFFVLRDVLLPNQSIGKRIVGLKVSSATTPQVSVMQSVLRNAAAIPIVLLPFPYIGYGAGPLLAFAFAVECFSVMTTGRRFGDNVAHTVVVNA